MIVNLTRVRAIVTNAKSALAHAVNRNPVGQEAADFGIAAAGLVVVEEALTELERKHGKFLNDTPIAIAPAPVPVAGQLRDDAKLILALDDLVRSGGSVHFEEQHEFKKGIEVHRAPAFILLTKTGHLEAEGGSLAEVLVKLSENKARRA